MMVDTPPPAKASEPMPGWLGQPEPLCAREVAHWQDFVFDRDHDPGAASAWLAVFYRGFVKAIRIPVGVPTPVPFPPREPAFAIPPLRDETALFDRLAGRYGDASRGSAVFNYLLSAAAVFAALIGFVLHSDSTVLGSIEVLVLALIAAVYVVGRGTHPEHEAAGGGRLFCQRWHERWLDYRGLAERFRYAELLGLLQHEVGAVTGSAEHEEPEDWPSRYFRAHVRGVEWTPRNTADYGANLLAALDEQQRYHRGNGHLCRQLSHHLHLVTVCAFLLSLLAASLHLGFLVRGQHLGSWWIVATAGLPALAAALHGIHNACEYAKLARTSEHMESALTTLRRATEDLLAREPAPPTEAAALPVLIGRFLHLSTDEASGWRAALWDKNVPLA